MKRKIFYFFLFIFLFNVGCTSIYPTRIHDIDNSTCTDYSSDFQPKFKLENSIMKKGVIYI